MKLSFDAAVEAFRGEFLAWLAANRPSAAEMEADPARSSRARAGLGAELDAAHVRRGLARAGLAARSWAGATRAPSSSSSISRS